MYQRFFYFLFFIGLYLNSHCQDVKFSLPLHGTPGKDFFIDYYMDHDPLPTLRDAYCGTKTYEDHTGTDFSLRSFKAMDSGSGVYVYAVADGKVLSTTDGMYDRNKQWISGGYGNHIIILHGDHYKTTYAHLAKLSIMVKQGDSVKTGQPIAKVGSSGYSKGPHLHLEVNPLSNPDSIIDPFTGNCQDDNKSLWITDPPYDTALYVIDQGMVGYIPTIENLQERLQLRDTFYYNKDEHLSYWIQLHGLRKGYAIQAKWINPRGYLYAGRKEKLATDEWYVYHWASMKVPKLGGEWILQYYINDKLIASRTFFVERRKKN